MNIVNIVDDDGNVISCNLDPKWTVNFFGDNNKITQLSQQKSPNKACINLD